MEKYMAEFGQGFVQTAVLSENNAVRYKLSISGSCPQSTVRAFAKLQDQAIGPATYQPGLTALVFNTATLKIEDTKNYNLQPTHTAVNQAFITFMNSLPAGKLVMLISEGKLRTSQELTDWFYLKNSTVWPTPWDTNTIDVAYSAFYISGQNSVALEHVLYNDGITKEPVSTILETVFDYFDDIGSIGFPKKTLVALDEVISAAGASVSILRLPEGFSVSAPIADYNIKPGDMMYLKFALYVDAGASGTIAGTTRASIRWFNNTTLLSSVNIDTDVSKPKEWQTFERDLVVPNNCNQFTLYFAKTNAADVGGVKNVVLCEVSRPEYPLMRPAEFGVNGIRMNRMLDGSTTDLLVLANTDADERGRVMAAEFREKQ